jgi:outer membrane beta-barrel protein
MENRIKRFILAIGLINSLFIQQSFAADEGVQVVEPQLDRRTIKPDKIDTENFEIGVYAGMISIQDFDSNSLLGVRAAYHITEDFFFELGYGESEGGFTSFEELSGSSPLFTDEEREYSYYDLSLGWNILPGEVFIFNDYAFNSSLYLLAGVGNTEFAGDEWFTVNIGAGFRLLLTDAIAWHIGVRDHIFDRDTLGEEETTHNIEFNTGFTVFF